MIKLEVVEESIKGHPRSSESKTWSNLAITNFIHNNHKIVIHLTLLTSH